MGWDQNNYWGFLFLKVQSLWSKVQHICLFSKELSKSNPSFGGHRSPSVPIIEPEVQMDSTVGIYAVT
jgi:hypothetical protein